MTRAIETAIIVLEKFEKHSAAVPIMVSPDLREAHDAECNKGIARAAMQKKYPKLDFLHCSENWDYELHTVEAATRRAERVRKSLKELTTKYQNILVISHRGFLAYLVRGLRFDVCG
jgi:broad specificity phosphatase PhoE